MANTKLLSRIVLYTLTAADAIRIKRHRELHLNFGIGTHFNEAKEGDVLPMIVVAGTDGDGAVNGQIFCDGVDSHWVTSVKEGTGVGTFVVYKPTPPPTAVDALAKITEVGGDPNVAKAPFVPEIGSGPVDSTFTGTGVGADTGNTTKPA